MAKPSPLAGIRVLDLSRVLAGPWAGQLFADLGADVIKVESPAGDDTRRWGPPFVENADGTRDGAYYHATNRGKRSLVADLDTAEGRNEVTRLAASADVLIENFRLGSLAKHGLDYETLAQANAGLIYCSITGFGQTGPYARRAGYDLVIQAMSGMMSLTGEPDGAPTKMGVAMADIVTGLYAVIGVQAALWQRTVTGRGQHIDLSLLDCMLGVLANQGMNYLVSGESPQRHGNAHPNIVPYQTFPVRDGWVVLAIGNDRQFRSFCSAADADWISAKEEYRTNALRVEHRDAVVSDISSVTQGWNRDELLALLEQAGVPSGPIYTVAEAFSDPQVKSRGMELSMTRSTDGKSIPGIRTPLRFSEADLVLEDPSPESGPRQVEWRTGLP